jgi:hypothetical protein
VAEGLDEAVGGNYLYHATGSNINDLKNIISNGLITNTSNQERTGSKLRALSFTRNWRYALTTKDDDNQETTGIANGVIFVVDQSILKQKNKMQSVDRPADIINEFKAVLAALPTAESAMDLFQLIDGSVTPAQLAALSQIAGSSTPIMNGRQFISAVAKPYLADKTNQQALANAQSKIKQAISYLVKTSAGKSIASAGGSTASEYEEVILTPLNYVPFKDLGVVGYMINPEVDSANQQAIRNFFAKVGVNEMPIPNSTRPGTGVAEGVPQPGESSGAPKKFGPDAKIETVRMTVKQIISSIPGVPYYNNVVDDWDAKDYSWGVTKKTIEYATYLKEHPESLAQLPPILVLNGKFEDGAHRVSAIWLLQQRMDPKNPLWENAKLNVHFVEQGVDENFADGKNPQDKGDAKRHGVNTKGSVSSLRKTAKQGGRKGQLAHWMANMKAGKAKKNETLTEAVIHPSTMDALEDFLPFVMKLLKLDKLPRISVHKTIETGSQPSFGGYNPADGTIQLALKDRHPADVLRTLAHELVHFKQDQQGELDEQSGATGSNEENEANTKAGIIMRHFNKRFPQYLE